MEQVVYRQELHTEKTTASKNLLCNKMSINKEKLYLTEGFN